jgi:DNA-directed RNA polymerase specialized sigma24 family protein
MAMISAWAGLHDSYLIDMALAGQTDSFMELMGRHQNAAKRRIRAIVRNPSDADDLLQNVLFKAWRGLSAIASWR